MKTSECDLNRVYENMQTPEFACEKIPGINKLMQ